MPIPVNIEKEPQEILRHLEQPEKCSNSIGSTSFYINDIAAIFSKSGNVTDFPRYSFGQAGTQYNEIDKKFIKFSSIIANQYQTFSEFYSDISLNKIKSITSEIISKLLSLSPDAFSLELTNDESIFYTFKKDNYSFYIQQFFEIEDDGFNATLVTFKGDIKDNSKNGNIAEHLLYIEQIFSNTTANI